MGIPLQQLLGHPIFSGCRTLAGQKGVSRRVCRISVFDCPFHPELADQILVPGDLFLSCLEQFRKGDSNLQDFLFSLVEHDSAGLLIVSTGNSSVLDVTALAYCETHHFPVLQLVQENSYAQIMDVLNRFLSIDMQNSANLQKLYQIRFEAVSEKERWEILQSLNPAFENQIQVLAVKGDFVSLLSQLELTRYFQDYRHDLLVTGKNNFMILSGREKEKLQKHTKTIARSLERYFAGYHGGISRIHSLREIREALLEAERASEIAKTMQLPVESYDPLSSLQLLIMNQGSQEEREFYQAYVEAVSREVSTESLPEFLHTIEAFVSNAGNYKKTAEEIRQHENTVRYRINRVKQALHLQDNTIRFYETIALAVELQKIVR